MTSRQTKIHSHVCPLAIISPKKGMLLTMCIKVFATTENKEETDVTYDIEINGKETIDTNFDNTFNDFNNVYSFQYMFKK